MHSSNLKKILAFLTLISSNAIYAQNNNKNSEKTTNNKTLVKPEEYSLNKINNYISLLKDYQKKNNKIINIDQSNKDLINMSKDQYFIELVARIHRRMQVISQDEKL